MPSSNEPLVDADTQSLKIVRTPLHDRIVQRLHDMITEGELEPGQRLNELALAARLDVSRTPLREALRVLASQRLVTLSPNQGAFVTRMTRAEIADAFEMMSALERFSAELACERITDAELAVIHAEHVEMMAHWAQRDLPSYYRANQRIHDLINQAARNEVLRESYLSLNRRLHPLRLSSNRSAGKWQSAIDAHERMLAALERRDGAALGELMRRHLLEKRDAVLAVSNEDR